MADEWPFTGGGSVAPPAPTAQRTMYDSINASAIPADAELVAGYVDGALSKWSDSDWARFPNATFVQICTWGPRHLGNCLDIEAGDSVPEDAPDWVDNAIARGVNYPILYCSLSAWSRVRQLVGNRPVQWWIADYDGQYPHIPEGADACQYADQPVVTGGDYDLSLCQPWFPRQ